MFVPHVAYHGTLIIFYEFKYYSLKDMRAFPAKTISLIYMFLLSGNVLCNRLVNQNKIIVKFISLLFHCPVIISLPKNCIHRQNLV